jgi:anti-sigma factor (TIGR02949 family)
MVESMNCTDFDRIADPLVDGELAEGERNEAEAHLSTCSNCHRQVDGLRALKGAVKRSSERAAPHHLREAVRIRIRQEPIPLMPALRWAPAYAAAAAVAAASWGGYKLTQQRGRSAEPLVKDAVEAYIRNIPRDIETRDPVRAVSWAQTRLGFNPRVPQLPLELVGASVTNVGDHAAADYQFQNPAGRRASLVVFNDPNAAVDAPTTSIEGQRDAAQVSRNRGYPVVLWRNDGIVYILTGDLDEQDIPRVVQSLGR